MTHCPMCSWYIEEGAYHDCTDEAIGSLLERWTTRDTGNRCRFDNIPLADSGLMQDPERKFCGQKCREAWKVVVEARLVIGIRDLNRRGFD